MQKNDKQLGTPFTDYRDTKSNLEAIQGLVGGETAYAIDTGQDGYYNHITGAWVWLHNAGGGGGSSINAQDEGVPLGVVTTFNFVGAPVDVSVSGTVARVFITGSSGGTSVHNDLTGIQGGQAGQYFHLNSAQILGLVSGSFTNLHYHSGTYTTEELQDIIGAMFSGNTETGISAEYDDTSGKINLVALTIYVNAEDIFRCDTPGGTSAFVGTIATLPGGATLTYNVSSGSEGAMVPTSTGQLGKMRLYNTTRGTSALISNCNTGTNTITLTANVPVGWATTDVITIASQTVSGVGVAWVDIEITEATLLNKSALLIFVSTQNATVNNFLRTHPTETFATPKLIGTNTQEANVPINNNYYMPMNSNMFSLGWSAVTNAPTNVIVRILGYLP